MPVTGMALPIVSKAWILLAGIAKVTRHAAESVFHMTHTPLLVPLNMYA